MPEDLLSTRLEILTRSVVEIRNVINALSASRQGIQTARRGVRSAKNISIPVSSHQQAVRFLGDLVEELGKQPDTPGELLEDFQSALEQLQKVQEELETASKKLQTHTTGIEQNLTPLADRAVHSIKVIEDRVKLTTEAALTNLNDLRGVNDPKKRWERFLKAELPGVETLFAAYIDVLGGVAIRERGVELRGLHGDESPYQMDELCKLTEELVQNELANCCSAEVALLSVPARSLGRVSSWPLLRLDLAQWSVWGIPLQAFEFGQLVIDRPLRAMDASADSADGRDVTRQFSPALVRSLAADTIATLILGPAYACALLYLQLAPLPHPNGQGGDEYRARIVKMVLERFPGNKAAGLGYSNFIEDVFRDWEQTSAALIPNGSGDESSALHWLASKVEQDLTRTFDLEEWDLSRSLWDDVISELEVDQSPELPLIINGKAIGIRHLLNAAWYGRLRSDRPSDDIERIVTGIGQQIIHPPPDFSGGRAPWGGVRQDRPNPPSQPSSGSTKRVGVDIP